MIGPPGGSCMVPGTTPRETSSAASGAAVMAGPERRTPTRSLSVETIQGESTIAARAPGARPAATAAGIRPQGRAAGGTGAAGGPAATGLPRRRASHREELVSGTQGPAVDPPEATQQARGGRVEDPRRGDPAGQGEVGAQPRSHALEAEVRARGHAVRGARSKPPTLLGDLAAQVGTGDGDDAGLAHGEHRPGAGELDARRIAQVVT